MAGFIQRVICLLVFLFSLQACALIRVADYLDSDGNLTPHGLEFSGKAAINDRVGIVNHATSTNSSMSPKPYGIVNETAQFFSELNSQRTTIKYGPFSVPSMSVNDGMKDFLNINIQMPCKDCVITWMQASLEYPNGTYANANTSLWLHHVVMINYMRPDTVCGKKYYGQGQRWFASGNERTPVDFSRSGSVPSGYFVDKSDMQIFLLELMNQQMAPQDAVLTMTYEYIPAQPYDFYQIKPIWLDIGGCKTADMPPKSNTTFSYKMNESYAVTNWTGSIIGMGAHLHDGGVNVNIMNNNKSVCNAQSYYGGPGYIGPDMDMDGMDEKSISKRHGGSEESTSSSSCSMSMKRKAKRHGGGSESMPGMDMSGMNMGASDSATAATSTDADGFCIPDGMMEHVSYMSSCYAPYVGQLAPGDHWSLEAFYNFTEHEGMTTTEGGLDDIMGIAVMYVAENMTAAQIAKYAGAYTPNNEPPQPASASSMMHPPLATMMPDMGDDASEGHHACRPGSDSPGNLHAQGVDLNDPDQASDYLMKILDDACLQVWSNAYARAFWYGIVVVIGLFAVANTAQWAILGHKKRLIAAGKVPGFGSNIVCSFYRLYRGVSYPTIGLSKKRASIYGIPPLGTVLMIVVYISFLMALNFIKVSTHDDQHWQAISVRSAWLSMAQLPLIILLTMKRNLINWVSSVSYERLNVLHRWTARGLLLTGTIHFATQHYGWMRLGLATLEWTTDDCPITGIAVYSILLWMNLTTLRPLRNLSYEFFVIQHVITWVGFIVALMLHIPSTAPYAKVYVWISIGIYIFCKLVQAIFAIDRNFPTGSSATFAVASPAISTTSNKSAVTKLTIKSANIGRWKPGAHIRLNIPRYGILETHPATILSTPSSHSGDLVLLLRAHNGFTTRIARAASSEPTKSHKAIVDGPYGGTPVDMAAFETIVLIAGSTGVSYTLPILLDLAERCDLNGRSLPVRNVVFVWAVRHKDAVAWIEPELQSALASLSAHGVNVDLRIHITQMNMQTPSLDFSGMLEKAASEMSAGVAQRQMSQTATIAAPAQSVSEKGKEDRPVQVRSSTVASGSSSSSRASNISEGFMATALQVVSGRPDVRQALHDARAKDSGEMGVAVCGPQGMSADVRNAVAAMQWDVKQGEGVWLHVEGFGW